VDYPVLAVKVIYPDYANPDYANPDYAKPGYANVRDAE
jgi:hypothetical protein